MQTMDSSLMDLFMKGLIRKDVALTQSVNLEEMKKYIK